MCWKTFNYQYNTLFLIKVSKLFVHLVILDSANYSGYKLKPCHMPFCLYILWTSEILAIPITISKVTERQSGIQRVFLYILTLIFCPLKQFYLPQRNLLK